MAELVKVVVDAMGGDNAPVAIVKGAVEALLESDKLFVVDVEGKPVQDLLPVKINNNVFQRYDEILIHYYCIPLCGISRYRASSRAVSSLGRHKVLDESAPIMPPRKGLLHGRSAAAAHTTPMCQGRDICPQMHTYTFIIKDGKCLSTVFHPKTLIF